jgi:hypothetical protein
MTTSSENMDFYNKYKNFYVDTVEPKHLANAKPGISRLILEKIEPPEQIEDDSFSFMDAKTKQPIVFRVIAAHPSVTIAKKDDLVCPSFLAGDRVDQSVLVAHEQDIEFVWEPSDILKE